MASLKSLKNRISGVKSTQKITRAMRMVAASKLMRARKQLDNALNYINSYHNLFTKISINKNIPEALLPLFKSELNNHLIILITSDKGLCGAYNSNIIRTTLKKVADIEKNRQQVKLLVIGKKGNEVIRRLRPDLMIQGFDFIRNNITIHHAKDITTKIIDTIYSKQFNSCEIIYSSSKSAILQLVKEEVLIPIKLDNDEIHSNSEPVEFEPSEKSVLSEIAPKYLTAKIYHILLQSNVSEHAARMTSMDSATNNTEEMLKKLSLKYNMTRQAIITKELIEIISGAESLK